MRTEKQKLLPLLPKLLPSRSDIISKKPLIDRGESIKKLWKRREELKRYLNTLKEKLAKLPKDSEEFNSIKKEYESTKRDIVAIEKKLGFKRD